MASRVFGQWTMRLFFMVATASLGFGGDGGHGGYGGHGGTNHEAGTPASTTRGVAEAFARVVLGPCSVVFVCVRVLEARLAAGDEGWPSLARRKRSTAPVPPAISTRTQQKRQQRRQPCWGSATPSSSSPLSSPLYAPPCGARHAYLPPFRCAPMATVAGFSWRRESANAEAGVIGDRETSARCSSCVAPRPKDHRNAACWACWGGIATLYSEQ